MNWLWTWPETIDVCQRTWDSALKLMNQFPDFGFAQSQPGAYVPIQQQFPAEFARIQQAGQRGQWDVVGGFWNESDTNMPSGEALVRSLFVGQRYFKQNFGRYAETGWLPDSFGHSAQLPQIYEGVGLRNFYHQRGGDGTRFAWWQSPDGSRVLKAQTDHYDAPVEPEQLTEPWDNARRYGLKQSLVVFGVGDHGGGPTREQILKGKAFQQSSLLPQVQFLTADAFFRQLRADPAANILPVISDDLQYVAVGGYTTHADVKADVRASENDLYTAEVLASLAAMRGRPYPIAGFAQAWKPTVFAQFHDIMCGTAIHSTYDWMREQLAPARRFTSEQIAQTLTTLAAAADTRGGQKGDPAIVVWNPHSFRRDDVVRVKAPEARRFQSVYDGAGHRYPVQMEDPQTLVFVALGVPGFGQAVYYLSSIPCTPPPPVAQSIGDNFVLENAFSRLTVAKDTGLITTLLHKATGQQMLSPGQPGNVLQVLDDDANAWDIHFTGPPHELAAEGAKVTLIENGPVYSAVQAEHTYNRSRFVQQIRVYNQVPRIDILTNVDWHEHGRMLKVAFSLNIAHPDYRTGIPYGSIARPHNGQETPGQKWMDVTETLPGTLGAATPLEIQSLFNHNSGEDFDTEGRGFPRSEAPQPGVHPVGTLHVPTHFAATKPDMPDNIACAGQSLSFPANAAGNTLFLVGAGAPGAQDAGITFVRADGARIMRTVHLNDWMLEDRQSNDVAAVFSRQATMPGRKSNGGKPRLWLASVPIPPGRIKTILLPDNNKMHLFAITLAQVGAVAPRFGMAVLNDCKYGSDATGGVFRLSLLRSPNNPDPNPDEGQHAFTYSLWPHAGDSNAGKAEQAGLALNIPLRGVLTNQHAPQDGGTVAPFVTLQTADHRDNLVAGALKHSEDGRGYILRFFETQGRDTTALLTFSRAITVEETDLLERPLVRQRGTMQGRTVRLPVGHDKIVTLHITGLPDAGRQSSDH